MKHKLIHRVIAVGLILLTLSACSLPNFNGNKSNPTAQNTSNNQHVLLTKEDSVVTLDVYPEYSGYPQIHKFDRFQFNNLDAVQQSVYIALDNAIYNMQTGYVNVGECSYRDLELAYYALRCDRPEYFWLPSSYSLKVQGEKREMCFARTEADWYCTKNERREIESTIKSLLSEFCEQIPKDLSQYDRELLAHDWLCERLTYDHEATKQQEEKYFAWTIEGAFTKGSAVCEGYSRAMQMLCYLLGIDCTTVTGITHEAHMWNCVNIDDAWYHLDVTSNDSGNKGFHSFFNVTDDYLLVSRTIDGDVQNMSDKQLEAQHYNYKLPVCNARANNFYVKSSALISDINAYPSTVISLVCDAAQSGRNTVELGFSDKLGFVFGRTDINELGDLKRIIGEANNELPKNLKITKFNYSGLTGALGFKISW